MNVQIVLTTALLCCGTTCLLAFPSAFCAIAVCLEGEVGGEEALPLLLRLRADIGQAATAHRAILRPSMPVQTEEDVVY